MLIFEARPHEVENERTREEERNREEIALNWRVEEEEEEANTEGGSGGTSNEAEWRPGVGGEKKKCDLK